jgi:hypothetical protein
VSPRIVGHSKVGSTIILGCFPESAFSLTRRSANFFENVAGNHLCLVSSEQSLATAESKLFPHFRVRVQTSVRLLTYLLTYLRSITLIFHRLKVFMGNSKSGEGNSMGVRFPLPAPSNLFICNMLQGGKCWKRIPPVQIRYTAYPSYFNCLPYSNYGSGTAIYMH